jgi:HAE1 family hydrophobic/amphiphilic exporter-1
VIGIALILSAVFVPVALLGGLVGSMYKQFALTIAISVLLSAFNALSLTPRALRDVYANTERCVARSEFFPLSSNKIFDVIPAGYVHVSRMLIRPRIIPSPSSAW